MTSRDDARRPDAGAGAGTSEPWGESGDALRRLGWDDTWTAELAAAREGLRGTGRPGRVVAEHRDRYIVAAAEGDRPAVLGGRLRHEAETREALPAVGDWVVLEEGGGGAAGAEASGTPVGASSAAQAGQAVVRAVLPRRSAFRRKLAGTTTEPQVVAANVDVALLATALPDDLNARRLERYLTLAWESGALPIVLLTKADLAPDLEGALATARLAAPGATVIALSARTGEGLDALERELRPGSTAVLLGSSGVGKSTLVNRLLGEARLKTAATGDDGRGRHTTTHRELVRLASGALLVDTPGMRELQLWSDGDGLDEVFTDIDALAAECRFSDCRHETEPGCAVRAAVASGALDAARLDAWRTLGREIAWLARRRDELAASAEKARVKALHREQRRLLNGKYGG